MPLFGKLPIFPTFVVPIRNYVMLVCLVYLWCHSVETENPVFKIGPEAIGQLPVMVDHVLDELSSLHSRHNDRGNKKTATQTDQNTS